MNLYGMPNPAGAAGSSIMMALQGSTSSGGGTGSATVAPTPVQSGIGSAAYSGPGSNLVIGGQPFVVFLGLILVLAIGKFLSEHESTALEPADLHIGPYNLIAVTIASSVGIVLMKVLANKYPVPGLTQFANFI